MTPYEEYNRRMMADAIRRQTQAQAQMPPGMITQSAGPVVSPEAYQSLQADENKLARSRAMVDQLRGGGMPQGRSVGPSGIYVGPNIGETLGYAGKQIAGGLLNRQANEADAALDERRTARGLAQARQAAAETARLEGRADLENLRNMSYKWAALNQDAAQHAAGIESAEAIASNKLEQDIAKMKSGEAQGSEEMVYVSPDGIIDWANTREAYMTPKGMMFSETEVADPSRWIRRDDPNLQAQRGQDLPASVQKDMMEKNAAQMNIDDAIASIDALHESGQSTSGARAVALAFVPGPLKGMAENYLYNLTEQQQRAKNAYIDAQVKEAITTGVISDQDAIRLQGLNINDPGLTPAQQVVGLQAIDQVMSKYGDAVNWDPQGGPGVSSQKPISEMSIEELEEELRR